MLVLSVSWPSAPKEAFIVGLKELPESEDPVIHRHIFYTHAHQVGPLLFNLRTERLYPNNSMYVFDILFSIHFLQYKYGEFVLLMIKSLFMIRWSLLGVKGLLTEQLLLAVNVIPNLSQTNLLPNR